MGDKLSKTMSDKIDKVTETTKNLTEKIEKLDSSSKADSSSSSKLVTLTKAIDSIQENSKSLENMVKGMKTEFATPKDLEKLRVELSKGGMGLDPNDATMGPIMDSLIMTSKYLSELL